MTKEAEEHLKTLRERRNWLKARIEAKESVSWDTVWDRREQQALAWAVETLEKM